MESNKSILKKWGKKQHLQQFKFSWMVASVNSPRMFTYRDTGLSSTGKSLFCDGSGFDALLFSQKKGQLFFISSRRAVAELLNYNTGACVKRDSSPAHKASLKWQEIPEITHSNASRAASSLQLSKQRKLQRVHFRAWGLPHRDESEEKGRALPAALNGAMSDQPLPPSSTPCSATRSKVDSCSPGYFKWRWRNH